MYVLADDNWLAFFITLYAFCVAHYSCRSSLSTESTTPAPRSKHRRVVSIYQPRIVNGVRQTEVEAGGSENVTSFG